MKTRVPRCNWRRRPTWWNWLLRWALCRNNVHHYDVHVSVMRGRATAWSSCRWCDSVKWEDSGHV